MVLRSKFDLCARAARDFLHTMFVILQGKGDFFGRAAREIFGPVPGPVSQSVFRVSNFVDSSSLKSPQLKSPQKHSKSPRGQQRDEITSNEITSKTPQIIMWTAERRNHLKRNHLVDT